MTLKALTTQLLASITLLLCVTAGANAMPHMGNLQLWLDGSDVDGNNAPDVLANGSSVTTWFDKSGNGFNATSSGISAPTYVSVAPNLGGAPALRFDNGGNGGNNLLTNAGVMGTFGSSEATMFTVYNANLPTGNNHFGISTTGTAANEVDLFAAGSFNGDFRASRLNNLNLGFPTTTGAHIKGVQTSAANGWRLSVDGVPTPTQPHNFATAGALTLGRSNHGSSRFDGEIAEVLIYNSDLSQADYNQTVNYLSAKYGITATPPPAQGEMVLRLAATDYDPNTGVWTDSSGKGHHASASGGGANPMLVPNATPAGVPAVMFDGSSDRFDIPNAVGNGLDNAGGAEVFIVLQTTLDPQPGTPDGRVRTGLWNFGEAGAVAHYPWIDGNIYDEFGSNQRPSSGNPTQDLTELHIYNVSTQDGSWQNFINNELLHTNNGSQFNGFVLNPTLGSHGGGFWFDGKVVEVRIYAGDFNEDERTAIYNELVQTALTANVVPEPATATLAMLSLTGLLLRRRRAA